MFTAIVPPAAVLKDLADYLERRTSADPSLRWAAPDQWHLTLAFMADVPDRCLDELVVRLGRAASRRTSFSMQLTGAGAFPDPARARVLWLGADEGARDRLVHVAAGARAAAVKSGIAVDGARFRAHLTVARVRRPSNVTRWLRILDAYDSPSFEVGELALVASHLGEGPRRRPRYDSVAMLPLAAPDNG